MKSFSKITESVNDVRYIRNVVFDEDHKSYFDFVQDKSTKYDDQIKNNISDLWEIIYLNIEANVGDTVFLVVEYNVSNDVIVYAYKDVYTAFSTALKSWKEWAIDNENYGIKIFKHKITEASIKVNHKSYEFFERKDYILYGNYNGTDGINELNIVPEYSNNPKIKNLMLSLGGINKFKL